MFKVIGAVSGAVCLVVAWGITASIDLPTPADVAIWAVAGFYCLSYVVAGLVMDRF